MLSSLSVRTKLLGISGLLLLLVAGVGILSLSRLAFVGSEGKGLGASVSHQSTTAQLIRLGEESQRTIFVGALARAAGARS